MEPARAVAGEANGGRLGRGGLYGSSTSRRHAAVPKSTALHAAAATRAPRARRVCALRRDRRPRGRVGVRRDCDGVRAARMRCCCVAAAKWRRGGQRRPVTQAGRRAWLGRCKTRRWHPPLPLRSRARSHGGPQSALGTNATPDGRPCLHLCAVRRHLSWLPALATIPKRPAVLRRSPCALRPNRAQIKDGRRPPLHRMLLALFALPPPPNAWGRRRCSALRAVRAVRASRSSCCPTD